jgi:hypothetical protein
MPAFRLTRWGCHAQHTAPLIPPTTAVRDSYLAGETEPAIEEGLPTDWLREAAGDFAGFVERRRTIREQWASR